jgi:phage shock protein A
LQTRLREANAEHSRVASYVREVERFLNAVRYAGHTSDAAASARERLERELAEVDQRLAQLRERTRATQASSSLRSDIGRAERQVEASASELARHLAIYHGMVRFAP